MTTSDLLTQRASVFGAGAPLFYNEPVHIVRGEGVWLFDPQGRKFLDMYNNVPCVGHANPHVVAAMQSQAATLNVHSRYLHDGVLEYAERLMRLHSDNIESVVFTCSGTEASEVALMMARAATNGVGIICTDAAYHGNSTEVRKLARLRNLPGDGDGDAAIRAIPYPNRFRPIEAGLSDAELCERYLRELRAAIDDFEAKSIPFAGLMLCSILANEGLPNVPAGFMSAATEMVHTAGGLMIADEVQAGFCRTGHWWGYSVMDFVPDIVTMGKPMGNGLPLAGTAASRDLVECFRERYRYFNTFASSPLQAAVGSAVIDVIEQRDLATHVDAIGRYLREQLSIVAQRCPAMGDVRGHGLFVAVEWVDDTAARAPDLEGAVTVVNRLKDKGFLISNAGADGNVLKIRPPLVFEREHAELFLNAFDETLAESGCYAAYDR